MANARPVGDDPGRQAGAEQAQTKPQTDQTPRILDAIERGVNRITSVLETLKSEPESAREEQRAERDLDSQEGMAYWAELMFWAAVGSVVLTTFGVLLLTGTLVYTKRAAEFAGKAVTETEKATRAANEAVEVARDTARRQLRAYVGIEYAEVLPPPDECGFKAKIVFKNFGQTPAYETTVRRREKTVGTAVLDSFDNNLDGITGTPRCTLGAGSRFQVTIDNILGKDERELLLKEEAITIIVGDIGYRDIFGQFWTENFWLRVYRFGTPDARLSPWNEEGNAVIVRSDQQHRNAQQ